MKQWIINLLQNALDNPFVVFYEQVSTLPKCCNIPSCLFSKKPDGLFCGSHCMPSADAWCFVLQYENVCISFSMCLFVRGSRVECVREPVRYQDDFTSTLGLLSINIEFI